MDLRRHFDRTMPPPDSLGDATYLKGEMYLLRAGNQDPLIVAPIGFTTKTKAVGANVRTDGGASFSTPYPH